MADDKKPNIPPLKKASKPKAPHTATPARKKLFLEALEGKAHGYLSIASAMTGIPVRTVYSWRQKDKRFGERVNQAQSLQVDDVEALLYKRMTEGSDAAIIFFLKTRGGEKWRERRDGADAKAAAVNKITVEVVGGSETTTATPETEEEEKDPKE